MDVSSKFTVLALTWDPFLKSLYRANGPTIVVIAVVLVAAIIATVIMIFNPPESRKRKYIRGTLSWIFWISAIISVSIFSTRFIVNGRHVPFTATYMLTFNVVAMICLVAKIVKVIASLCGGPRTQIYTSGRMHITEGPNPAYSQNPYSGTYTQSSSSSSGSNASANADAHNRAVTARQNSDAARIRMIEAESAVHRDRNPGI